MPTWGPRAERTVSCCLFPSAMFIYVHIAYTASVTMAHHLNKKAVSGIFTGCMCKILNISSMKSFSHPKTIVALVCIFFEIYAENNPAQVGSWKVSLSNCPFWHCQWNARVSIFAQIYGDSLSVEVERYIQESVDQLPFQLSLLIWLIRIIRLRNFLMSFWKNGDHFHVLDGVSHFIVVSLG